MNVSLNTRQAYSEIDEFLELLNEEKRNKIPRKLRQFFKEEKDYEYRKGIRLDIPIKEQNLKKETLSIIALLNLQYWCQDEREKDRLKRIYKENELAYEEMLKEKFNPDNIFKKRNQENEIEQNIIQSDVALVEYKESIFKRLINKLKSIFHIS